MNKIIFSLALALMVSYHGTAKDKKSSGESQKTEKAKVFMISDTDTTKLLRGKVKIISHNNNDEKTPDKLEVTTKKDSVRKILETSWGCFDIGFNNYIDKTDYNALVTSSGNDKGFISRLSSSPSADDFELRPGKSVNINIGIVKQQLSLYKNYVSLVYGLTYDINNWSYKQSLTWNQASQKNTLGGYDGPFVTKDSLSFKKNKLVTNYLQVPVLLRFETSPHHADKNIYFSIGGYAGYLVRSHTKQIVAGTQTKIKQHNDFNINKFQYGAQFELGYRGFSLYFKRSLSALTDFGTVQYPYSFGFRLTGL